MCCIFDECNIDVFMTVLRCIGDTNKIFAVRICIGLVFDCCEAFSIALNKTDNVINIVLLVLTALLYITLVARILFQNDHEKDVYKFNYVFSFKFISLAIAVIIFNTTSSFDWNTIEQLYSHIADGNVTDFFLAAVNFVSILDMIFNSFSLIFLIWKMFRALKEEVGEGKFSKVFFGEINLNRRRLY